MGVIGYGFYEKYKKENAGKKKAKVYEYMIFHVGIPLLKRCFTPKPVIDNTR